MAHVLVIDDDHLMRDVLREMVERKGHKVLEANDGVQGLKVYSQESPDLVITDILMNKNGLEVIQELKRGFPAVKIIAMTGHNQDTLRMTDIV